MAKREHNSEIRMESRSVDPAGHKDRIPNPAPKSKRRAAGEGKPLPPAPNPNECTGPVSLSAFAGPLPDTPDELLAVIHNPSTLTEALAAIKKLGELYGRDITEDMSVTELQDFHPLITTIGIGSNPEAIKSFAVYAVPLRRALARCFQAKSPDIAMMVDLCVIAYWKTLQCERAAAIYLNAAIERPQLVDKIAPLERVKDLAVRQMVRLLEALRVATGRSAVLDPEADAAKLLRFPAELLHRRAARG